MKPEIAIQSMRDVIRRKHLSLSTEENYLQWLARFTTQDERGGFTSASSAEADSLCPGRHLAQRGLPEGEKSADATSGTRIHAALENGDANLLASDDELDCYTKCQQIENEVINKLLPGGYYDAACIREERLWIEFGGIKHSGKADLVAVSGDVAVIADYKSGRNEVTDSPRNLQMRDLAVLVERRHNVKTVHVVIIQPWATMTPEVCTYNEDDLLFAYSELKRRVMASNDPQSPRIPGEKQCQYCRSKSVCPEFMAASLPSASQALTPALLQSGIKSLTSSKLGAFLGLVRLAEETATAEVRRRIESGDPVDGWTLKPGRETEKITDATTVFNRALAAGVTQDAFVRDCVTVGKTALKKSLAEATGSKGKALDAEIETLLAGCTETKTSQPILTREK